MDYSPEQVGAIKARIRVLRMKGQPEVAFNLMARLKRGDPIEPWEYDPAGVRPEKGVTTTEAVPPHPPFTGVGSSGEAWRRWAVGVADVEPQVLESLGRDAIIGLLRDRGILPPEVLEGEPSKAYKPHKRPPKKKG